MICRKRPWGGALTTPTYEHVFGELFDPEDVGAVAGATRGDAGVAPNDPHADELSRTLLAIADTTISPELLPPARTVALLKTRKRWSVLMSCTTSSCITSFAVPAPPQSCCTCRITRNSRGRTLALNGRKRCERFSRVFFRQQYKRSCVPDGPKVGTVSLSPRGDWRMPSDADAAAWLDW